MFSVKYFTLYFGIIVSSHCWLVSAGYWGYSKDDIENNKTAFTILEEMITRQKLLNHLDGLKSIIEQLHLRSTTEDNESSDSSIFDIRIDTLPEKCQILGMPSNCAEATACTKRSGYYKIKLDRFNNDSFLVECDVHTDGGSWTVIQRRQDGSVDFYRPWSDYKAGFGDVDGEFFIGLDKLHALTNFDGPQELMILMENENGTGVTAAYAKYDSFAIGGECDKYVLKRIGKYSGTAGDSLQNQIGCKFSTKDRDNDNHSSHCAQAYEGGWWYNACHKSNLNGHYKDVTPGKGLNWYTLSGDTVSLKYVKMMIRRRKYKF